MAKSALLEQYSDIWIDKQDYLEAERIYYEGKLGSAVASDIAATMGRKNKSKQSVATPGAPPTPLSPPPSDSPVSPSSLAFPEPAPPGGKKRNDSESSNKSKGQGTKGKNNKGQAPKPGQAPKQSPLQPPGEVVAPAEGSQKTDPPPVATPPSSTSPDSGTKTQGAQTCKAEAQMDGIAKLSGDSPALLKKISALETENKTFKKDIQDLTTLVKKLELRLSSLESSGGSCKAPAPKPASCPAPAGNGAADDDVDLFGSDSEEESEEAAKIREERLAAYNAKKSKKPVLIAKSNIILDVKPWGDDTDMKAMETEVRKIQMEGLLWGASKLAPLAYGINKLQISCVVEDELVSVDALQEAIQDIEEYVQSVDIAAFNKV